MNTEQAFRVLQRQCPCPHESTEPLGDGRTWARCNDCGATVQQSTMPRARAAAKEFDDAIEHLRELAKVKK